MTHSVCEAMQRPADACTVEKETEPQKLELAFAVRDEFTRVLKLLRNQFGDTHNNFARGFCLAYADIRPAESMGEKYGVENTFLWFFGERKRGEWMCDGALYSLLNMLYDDQDKFQVSSDGVVFFEENICGAGVTKLTHVSVEYNKSTDRYCITLDPFYHYNW